MQIDDSEARVAREVLHLVLAERPSMPTAAEIGLALADGGGTDEVERAIDSLVRAGVLRREGDSILTTRATDYLHRLVEDGIP